MHSVGSQVGTVFSTSLYAYLRERSVLFKPCAVSLSQREHVVQVTHVKQETWSAFTVCQAPTPAEI